MFCRFAIVSSSKEKEKETATQTEQEFDVICYCCGIKRRPTFLRSKEITCLESFNPVIDRKVNQLFDDVLNEIDSSERRLNL
ncbi:hypothetical protein NECAME_05652 [Necator americanus]|uniref:Uncharacterized protein n=1 Tax=Necator americanus TaxID=51031 RepID=W2SFS7_NECAM|nr:hypothetical protein NECAME_05652 [Necator americanus]ETN68378.1 hypothetical protein NECAME_05652 [Necator americanus]